MAKKGGSSDLDLCDSIFLSAADWRRMWKLPRSADSGWLMLGQESSVQMSANPCIHVIHGGEGKLGGEGGEKGEESNP